MICLRVPKQHWRDNSYKNATNQSTVDHCAGKEAVATFYHQGLEYLLMSYLYMSWQLVHKGVEIEAVMMLCIFGTTLAIGNAGLLEFHDVSFLRTVLSCLVWLLTTSLTVIQMAVLFMLECSLDIWNILTVGGTTALHLSAEQTVPGLRSF